MRQHRYEIWSDESLATPYFLLVMPDEQMLGGVIVLDPREGLQVVHAAPSYEKAKDWLLEDEYTRVEGRMQRQA